MEYIWHTNATSSCIAISKLEFSLDIDDTKIADFKDITSLCGEEHEESRLCTVDFARIAQSIKLETCAEQVEFLCTPSLFCYSFVHVCSDGCL